MEKKDKPRLSNKPTIQDVGKFANVSIATVSRVINGKGTVSKDTKEKVQRAINELGFEIRKGDLLADDLSQTILVCVTELNNPFNVPVINGIQDAASNNGYDILLLQTRNLYVTYSDYEAILKNQKFAGIVFLSSIDTEQYKTITETLQYRVPIVFCSEFIKDDKIPYVSIDDCGAMEKATNYLVSLGMEKIGFVNTSLIYNYARERERGFRNVLEKNNITVDENCVLRLSSVDYQLAYSNILNLLSNEKIDALLCASDVYAIAAIKACNKLNIRVPEDCAIVGFDNIELSTMTNPPLTTIEQPNYQLGYQSFEILLDKIIHPSKKAKKIILDTELIVRESTPLYKIREGEK